MKPACSARKKHASAMSSGLPTRPTGFCSRRAPIGTSRCARGRVLANRVSRSSPGLTQFTRIRVACPRLIFHPGLSATMPPFEPVGFRTGSDHEGASRCDVDDRSALPAATIFRATTASRERAAQVHCITRSKSGRHSSRNGARRPMPACSPGHRAAELLQGLRIHARPAQLERHRRHIQALRARLFDPGAASIRHFSSGSAIDTVAAAAKRNATARTMPCAPPVTAQSSSRIGLRFLNARPPDRRARSRSPPARRFFLR